MRERYEIWRYSESWGKWIRYIYPDSTQATKRYEYLIQKGKKVRPPQPLNRGLPLADRVSSMVQRIFRRSAAIKRRSKLHS